MPSPKEVSVIIPTYKRKAWLKDCLDALTKQTYPFEKYEIIVCDDGSHDGTEELANSYKDVIYLSGKHGGPAAARNMGISAAKGSIIAFTDDDCIPTLEWIENGVKALKETGLDGIEGITTTDKDLTSPLSVLTYTYHGGGFMTCNAFYKRSVIESVKGFASERKMRFREDTDLAWRVMDSGFKLGFDDRPKMYHRVVKITPMQYVKKQIRLREPYWNAYMLHAHPKRFRESNEMIAGMISTHTMYLYPFWAAVLLSVLSFVYLPRSAFWLSLVILLQNYLIVVFLHTRMRSAIDLSHLRSHPFEFLRLASVWWIALLCDTYWMIAGMIRYRVLIL